MSREKKTATLLSMNMTTTKKSTEALFSCWFPSPIFLYSLPCLLIICFHGSWASMMSQNKDLLFCSWFQVCLPHKWWQILISLLSILLSFKLHLTLYWLIRIGAAVCYHWKTFSKTDLFFFCYNCGGYIVSNVIFQCRRDNEKISGIFSFQ